MISADLLAFCREKVEELLTDTCTIYHDFSNDPDPAVLDGSDSRGGLLAVGENGGSGGFVEGPSSPCRVDRGAAGGVAARLSGQVATNVLSIIFPVGTNANWKDKVVVTCEGVTTAYMISGDQIFTDEFCLIFPITEVK